MQLVKIYNLLPKEEFPHPSLCTPLIIEKSMIVSELFNAFCALQEGRTAFNITADPIELMGEGYFLENIKESFEDSVAQYVIKLLGFTSSHPLNDIEKISQYVEELVLNDSIKIDKGVDGFSIFLWDYVIPHFKHLEAHSLSDIEYSLNAFIAKAIFFAFIIADCYGFSLGSHIEARIDYEKII